MNFDTILRELGEFGRWQKIVGACLWLPVLSGGIHVLMFSFTGLEPKKFRCQIPNCDGDDFSFADFPEESLFPKNDDGDFDYCRYYQPNLKNGTCIFPSNSDVTVSCPDSANFAFDLDTFGMASTVTSEWGLICDESWKVSLIGSFYMLGLMAGSFICGLFSDLYGRRLVLLGSIAVSALGSLAGAFMPSYWPYLVTRFITAIGAEGAFLVPFTLSMELVGVEEKPALLPWVSYKTLLANFISVPFALGEAGVSLVANYARDWSTLQWTVSAFCCLHMLLYFVIPESPRWLIAQKKYKEAEALILSAAKTNGVTLSKACLQVNDQESGTVDGKASEETINQYGFKDLFHPCVRSITLVMFVAWPVTALAYFGLSMSMANLNDDLIVSFILGSLVEIPSYLFLIFMMDIWGRKPLFSSSLILSGVCCILAGTALEEGSTGRTVLALIGKFGASAAFNISYMYTAELYPTCIRNTAVGTCSTIARIGAISAPWVALYLPKVAPNWLSLVLYGAAALAGGVLTLKLPETLGSALPDTFEDLEEIKKKSKSVFACNCPSSSKNGRPSIASTR